MSMETRPVIVADGLTRRFGDVVAVDRLTLEVYPGEVFGFLGHNGAGKTTMGRVFFPNAMWIALALWVAPAVAGLGLGVTVLISARAQGFQEAYQMGAIVVLPILLLVIGQATGVMYFNSGLVLLLGLVLWAIDVALLWFGGRSFRRSELAARL